MVADGVERELSTLDAVLELFVDEVVQLLDSETLPVESEEAGRVDVVVWPKREGAT